MTWIEQRPKRVKKRDITGIRLMVSSTHAPKDSNIRGMSEVVVFSTKDTSLSYAVLCTQQDIDVMVEAYKQSKPFVFERKEDEEYASVQIVEPTTGEMEEQQEIAKT